MSGLSTPPPTQLAGDGGIHPTSASPPACHPVHYNIDVPDPIIFQVCHICPCSIAVALNGVKLRVG